MTELTSETSAAIAGVHGAIDAPVIYFDEAPVFGMNPSGVPSVLLCCFVQDVGPDGKPRTVKKAVAHLRGSLRAFHLLLLDLQRVETLLTRPNTPPN